MVVVERGKEARADGQRFIEISVMESLWCWHKDVERDALAWAGVSCHDLILKMKASFLHTVFLLMILSLSAVSLC